MSLILKEITKNKTVYRSFGPYETSEEVPATYYGYQNEQGKWVIKPEYEFATEFSSGIAIVGKEWSYKGFCYEIINEKKEVLFQLNKGREWKFNCINKVQIKDGLIVAHKFYRDTQQIQRYALINKAGQFVTGYTLHINEELIELTDPVMLAKQVLVAGSEVLNWGVSSLFLSEQNIKLFKDNLKHYLVKNAIDNKLNNEAIKEQAQKEKALFNDIVSKKQQEVFILPTYETKKEKTVFTLVEKELEV